MTSNGGSPERAILADARLGSLQKALLITDGTVTQLLEAFTGERMRVQKLHHRLVSDAPAVLALEQGTPVLSRTILLRGETRPYMHAQSWLVPSRMPPDMQRALVDTDTPIGQLWKAARLETFREIVDFGQARDAAVAALFPAADVFWSRAYLIHTGGRPMGLIEEKFPMSLFA